MTALFVKDCQLNFQFAWLCVVLLWIIGPYLRHFFVSWLGVPCFCFLSAKARMEPKFLARLTDIRMRIQKVSSTFQLNFYYYMVHLLRITVCRNN
jgi:hypothetical protein